METIQITLDSLQGIVGNLRLKLLTAQKFDILAYVDMAEVAIVNGHLEHAVELRLPKENAFLEIRLYSSQALKSDFIASQIVQVTSGTQTIQLGKGQATITITQKTRQHKHAPITVTVATWNVGNSQPPDDLTLWLWPDGIPTDVVVVGCQESSWDKDKDTFKPWVALLLSNLSKHGQYLEVSHGSLGQIHLVIFIKADYISAVRNVHVGTEATGLANVYHNKGGVIVSLDIFDSKFCFITSHLAAHEGEKKCGERNANFKSIVKGGYKAVRFSSDLDTSTGSETIAGGEGQGFGDIFNENHVVFWCGDLNYRLALRKVEEEQKEDDEVQEKEADALWKQTVETVNSIYQAKTGDYSSLFSYDELTRQIKEAKAFVNFQEQAIHFAPTFKMIKGKEQEYSTKRLPAWCDRVLWKDAIGSVKALGYWSAPTILTSDHRPVAAKFEVDVYSVPRMFDKVEVKSSLRTFTDSFTRAGTTVLTKDVVTTQKVNAPRYALRLLSLQCQNLPAKDVTGASDPYVVFFGSSLTKSVKTPVISRSLNPSWDVRLVPILTLSLVPEMQNGMRVQASDDVGLQILLSHDFLSVVVKDFDRGSKDDTCGRGVISLQGVWDAMKKGERRSDFSIQLEDDGLLGVGTMTGSWELINV